MAEQRGETLTKFVESGLEFTFDKNWEVCQLDKLVDYKKVSDRIPGTRSIDFIAYNASQQLLLFVEVKGFQGYGNQTNVNRLSGKEDDIVTEISAKVRDSLATIIGGARCSTHLAEIWKKYVTHINNDGKLKIVAWLEIDNSTQTRLMRANVNMSIRRIELRKKLIWLTSDVNILNTNNYANELPGVKVVLL